MTGGVPARASRALLVVASIAVAFAAADTYVVVIALPEMMGSVGIPVEELQRAAPIVSGFLLGYVAMLPLIGRIADLRGRVPVLFAALIAFAVGSLITAAAYDLTSMVTGRFLQGVGGGGLVPATLALVADLYPVQRRGVPLGVVSAVQELGSVLGPLFGAVVLAAADWPAIFAINVAVGLLLAAALRVAARDSALEPAQESPPTPQPSPRAHRDYLSLLLLLVAVVGCALVFVRPAPLLRDLTWGEMFVPFAGDGRWLTPVGAATVVFGALFLARCFTARTPLIDLRAWGRTAVDADLTGALLLAIALGGVILAFGTADPEVEVFADRGLWYLLGSAIATVALVIHLRRADSPLLPHGTLRRTPAWGAVVVSFFVGAALIAALIDIPIFARTTVYTDSQLMAALVLLRFLIALPVGAVLGGYLIRVTGPGLVTAAGMALAAIGFGFMSRWDIAALEHHVSTTVVLVVCGFGFGLALAPVNAAVLASTDAAAHGVATAMVVVARMVGMLVGISALTTLGLRSYYREQDGLASVSDVCGAPIMCDAYRDLQKAAGIAQEQTVFMGAVICAVIAGLLALVLFRTAATRGVSAAEALR